MDGFSPFDFSPPSFGSQKKKKKKIFFDRIEKALKLLEICAPRKIPAGFDESEDPKERFCRELEEFTYYIPPNFPFHIASSKVAPATQKSVENLVLNLRILRYVQKSDYKEVLSLERFVDFYLSKLLFHFHFRSIDRLADCFMQRTNFSKLLDILEKDITCIEPNTLKGVVDLYLSNDYVKGMNFVITIGRVFDRKDFAKFEPVAKHVLSPTIYEVQTSTLRDSAFRNLNKTMQNATFIFFQLGLQR